MATFDIFNDDAFSVSSLRGVINDVLRVPTMIGDMDIFTESGISTPTFMIERKGMQLNLVPTSPRGGVGQPIKGDSRKLIPLAPVHLQERDTILADVVYGVRAFGSETEVETMSSVVRQRLSTLRGNMDLTHEWHRMGAIKGQVLDADGSSVIMDVYSTFGMTQETLFWNTVTANTAIEVVGLTRELKRKIRSKLGGRTFTRVRVLCSESFLTKFMLHNKMKEAYTLWNQGAYFRASNTTASGQFVDFEFDGVIFTVVDAEFANGTKWIEDGLAYAYPEGVPDMFQSVFAPADYMETVNTVGVPYYAKQERMAFDKGLELEAQSNPLHFNMLPEAVIKLSTAAS